MKNSWFVGFLFVWIDASGLFADIGEDASIYIEDMAIDGIGSV